MSITKQDLLYRDVMTDTIIQIIEDEPLHANLLERALRQARFTTAIAADGNRGWREVCETLPALILLDLMLPGMSGHEICRLVRSTPRTRHIPIIMLTAVGTEEDRIVGLEMGADDYVVKPFSPREIVSRVQAVLRRTRTALPKPIRLVDASVTVQGPYFEVSWQDRLLTLSMMELALLRCLLAHEGKLIGATELVAALGEEQGRSTQEEVDHVIRFLRRKLDNARAGSIDILPGYRYRFLRQERPA